MRETSHDGDHVAMKNQKRHRLLAPSLLLGSVIVLIGAIGSWKGASIAAATAAAQSEPEAAESITTAVAVEREHRPTTTSIGTVVALRSISLRNELPGTVHSVRLTPGEIVEAGTVLVAFDVSVERAELQAQEAEATLTRTMLARVERMSERGASSQIELDTARAEFDVARARVARTRAIIARKTIRAPFRAKIGMSDVHVGQFLNEGSVLTSLQGVADTVYVDFTVAQHIAAGLRAGTDIEVFAGNDAEPALAKVLAVDARVDPETRNATVRARVANHVALTPGASVRVEAPLGSARTAVTIPVSALRKGPQGDHVFVLQEDGAQLRAHLRSVSAGDVLGDEVVIERGVAAGERIAASGAFKLREASLVAVANDTAKPSRPIHVSSTG